MHILFSDLSMWSDARFCKLAIFFGNRYAFHEKNGIKKVNNLPEKGELLQKQQGSLV